MAKSEIVDSLTGKFVLRAKGQPTLEGYGTIVIRQEVMKLSDPYVIQNGNHQNAKFSENIYYGTLYGKFRPVKNSVMFAIQKYAMEGTGGLFYQCALIKKDGRTLEDIGMCFAGEWQDDTLLRCEMDGKVNYLVRNKYGSTGKIFAMGVRNRNR